MARVLLQDATALVGSRSYWPREASLNVSTIETRVVTVLVMFVETVDPLLIMRKAIP